MPPATTDGGNREDGASRITPIFSIGSSEEISFEFSNDEKIFTVTASAEGITVLCEEKPIPEEDEECGADGDNAEDSEEGGYLPPIQEEGGDNGENPFSPTPSPLPDTNGGAQEGFSTLG